MNISMYTINAINQNFKTPVEAFKHFYEKGVRFGDIIDVELSNLPLHLYCDYLGEAGIVADGLVTVEDIASFDEEKRKKNIAINKGYIDQLQKLGIKYLMPAPSVEQAQSKDDLKKMQELLIEGFDSLAQYAKDSGVKVVMENQSVLLRADSKMNDVRYILDCVPELGYVLDAGNFFCVGENVLEAFDKLSDRLVHSHFKDWDYNEYGFYLRDNMARFEGVPLGDGIIPLKKLIEKMRKHGFSGNIVTEINALTITLDDLDRSVDFLRREINA